MKTSRIGSIDFFKFVFSIIVALYHAGYFYYTESYVLCQSGFIAVEFFFIVTGFLLTKTADNKHDKKLVSGRDIWSENVSMIKRKIFQIFPYSLLASITSLFICSIGQYSLSDIGHNLLFSINNILGLQMEGFSYSERLGGISWYLSILFLICFMLYPLLLKNRQLFTKYIAPISALLILGYLAFSSGSLHKPSEWLGIIYKGTLRGYSDIAIGCIAYELKLFLDCTNSGSHISYGILEIGGYITTLLYAIFHGQSDSHDFFIIPLIMLSVSISFSEKSILKPVFKSSLFNVLGLLSLSIYLNHYCLTRSIPRLFEYLDIDTLLWIYLLSVFVLSGVNYLLGSLLARWLNTSGRIVFTLIIVACVAFILTYSQTVYTYIVLSGNGSRSHPYQISSKEDLEYFRDCVNNGNDFKGKYFLQTDNIDLENEEWEPIGIYGSKCYFAGSYDGGNHVIDNLNVTSTSAGKFGNGGLFGLLNGTVENLGIEDGLIKGGCVGSIASHGTDKARILNCYNKASVTGSVRAGGICDNFGKGSVINCVNSGEISAPVSSPIVSYNAGLVASVWPEDYDDLPSTFTGEFIEITIPDKEESLYETLNDGLDQLIESEVIEPAEVSKWDVSKQ